MLYFLSMPFLKSIRLKENVQRTDAYPFNLPFLHSNDFSLEFPGSVTFFVGENGSGKSTLLEAIAIGCGFNPSGGSRNNTYEYKQTESSLSNALILSWTKKMPYGFFLRAESFFNFASHVDNIAESDASILMSYGDKSLHEQSHGESFLALFKNRFNDGIFLLDEPEAALSPTRQLAFLSILHELEKAGKSQFIIATHSPILLSYPGAEIYSFDSEGITEKSYKDTEHYKVTKDFLDSPESFFRHLFT